MKNSNTLNLHKKVGDGMITPPLNGDVKFIPFISLTPDECKRDSSLLSPNSPKTGLLPDFRRWGLLAFTSPPNIDKYRKFYAVQLHLNPLLTLESSKFRPLFSVSINDLRISGTVKKEEGDRRLMKKLEREDDKMGENDGEIRDPKNNGRKCRAHWNWISSTMAWSIRMLTYFCKLQFSV